MSDASVPAGGPAAQLAREAPPVLPAAAMPCQAAQPPMPMAVPPSQQQAPAARHCPGRNHHTRAARCAALRAAAIIVSTGREGLLCTARVWGVLRPAGAATHSNAILYSRGCSRAIVNAPVVRRS
jgi:hypothetical protein